MFFLSQEFYFFPRHEVDDFDMEDFNSSNYSAQASVIQLQYLL